MEQRRDLGMKQISFAGGDEEVERKRRCLESSREEKRASVDGGWRMVDGRSQPAGAGDDGLEGEGAAGVNNGCKADLCQDVQDSQPRGIP